MRVIYLFVLFLTAYIGEFIGWCIGLEIRLRDRFSSALDRAVDESYRIEQQVFTAIKAAAQRRLNATANDFETRRRRFREEADRHDIAANELYDLRSRIKNPLK